MSLPFISSFVADMPLKISDHTFVYAEVDPNEKKRLFIIYLIFVALCVCCSENFAWCSLATT